MKIFRLSQQLNLNLEGEENPTQEKEDISVIEDLNANEIKIFAFQNNITITPVNFETGKIIYLLEQKGDKDVYVMETWGNQPRITERKRFFYGLSKRDLDEYFNDIDFNKQFWDDAHTGLVLYHATDEENWPSIQRRGLFARSETRGINNRGMDEAVFTSSDGDSLSAYGDCLIEIDVGKMKEDGYMPEVGPESPLADSYKYEGIAHKIGMEDYSHSSEYQSEGVFDSTIAFFNNIPRKYLKRVQ